MIEKFKNYQAQTVPQPLSIIVSKAKGSYIYDRNKKYLDFVAGVSVCNLGHNNKNIVNAISKQLNKYSHVMVYGEFVQEPSVKLCELLVKNLPKNLDSVYLTNSGTEAVEAAIKISKRVSGKSKIVSALNSYHGSTHGALSVSGFEERKRAYRPLLPNVEFLKYNTNDLSIIDEDTACVILETIQGGAGFILPKNNFLKKVSNKCKKVGALLVLDELQTGLGRTGKLFAFEFYNVKPDILLLGKSLGGGFPIGAMITNKKYMRLFQNNPVLGHITTFGGHPVIAAAGYETLSITLKKNLHHKSIIKGKLFTNLLIHPKIREVRGRGLMLALILKDEETAQKLVWNSLNEGLILFWLLYEKRAVRITPPLTISKSEIMRGCKIILKVLDNI